MSRDARASERRGARALVADHAPEISRILHNQTALRLKAALVCRPDVVVVYAPYHLTRWYTLAEIAPGHHASRALPW
jgi:hypothetical protein